MRRQATEEASLFASELERCRGTVFVLLASALTLNVRSN